MVQLQTSIPVLECSGLSYSIGRKSVLKNVSFAVFPGEVLLVRGLNGSGKTTLLKAILHHDRYKDKIRFPENSSPRVSYLGHELGLYTTLSLEENLEYFRGIAGNCRSEDQVNSWLKDFRLWQRRKDPVSSFSRGMKQKAALVRALLPNVDLYLLDEPLTALDTEGEENAKKVLESVVRDSALVMVTHDPSFSIQAPTRVLELGENSK
ncbi:ABC transporter ATP-binding protein [Leptospira wolffii]|uniref:ABC transporter ATP-binding protein n=1 Tax=Leptospira wolffii TaxID=409998 RepID=A0A2M9Z7G9_9LEPT|nr:ABC transporter ATP-binding protein [Leptospira wolffii]PJZ64334.1 ABC transporter ATP-binding protein [Leptospira wolffii]TGK58296.1 ABC transporter ATP-binding protein [Leptospira wolffii]TGK66327.1 ABC transporter ATP-binding protein [Leptospira wolffii]TGK68974.1 ABC transporter ATP-binding protein [Leptospira wolffii]TGL27326.1 ABC transporter ATP-binding protein [Leptospira wolffii]